MKNKALASIAVGSLVILGGAAIFFRTLSCSSHATQTSSSAVKKAELVQMWYSSYSEDILNAAFFNDEYEKSISEKMSKNADIIFEKLSDAEKAAVKNYTGVNNISAFMNGFNFGEELNKTYANYANLISNLMSKNRLKEDIRLYRGSSVQCLNDLISNDGVIDAFLNANSEQDVNHIVSSLNGKFFIIRNGFTSTSTSFWEAARFVHCNNKERFRDSKNGVGVFFMITAKKGVNYLPLMHHSLCYRENEVLLDRNVMLKIKSAMFKIERDPNKNLFFPVNKILILECEAVNN